MTRNANSRTVLAFVLFATCVIAGVANGQETPPAPPARPSQGVFQGGMSDPQARQSLRLNGAVWAAYDSHILGSDTLGSTPIGFDDQGSGSYPSALASLLYDKRANRWTFGSALNSKFAYYPNLSRDVQQPVDGYDGMASLAGQFGRAQLRMTQSLSYQPYFMLQTLPVIRFDAPVLPGHDVAFSPEVSIFDSPALGHSSSASFIAPLGRRASVGLTYGFQGWNSSGQFADLTNQSAGVEVSRTLSRSTEITGTYSYQKATYDRGVVLNSHVDQHGGEAGFRHTRRVSATRTMRFYGGAGASALRGQFSNLSSNREGHQAIAHGGLSLQIARSWIAEAEFRRSLQLLQGLAEPYYGNSLLFGAGGLLGRRVDISLNAAYSQGAIGIEALSVSPGYDTRNASVRLRYAISRELAVSGEYVNSDYSFGSAAVLPPGVIRRLSRHAARAGLMWGVSLIGR